MFFDDLKAIWKEENFLSMLVRAAQRGLRDLSQLSLTHATLHSQVIRLEPRVLLGCAGLDVDTLDISKIVLPFPRTFLNIIGGLRTPIGVAPGVRPDTLDENGVLLPQYADTTVTDLDDYIRRVQALDKEDPLKEISEGSRQQKFALAKVKPGEPAVDGYYAYDTIAGITFQEVNEDTLCDLARDSGLPAQMAADYAKELLAKQGRTIEMMVWYSDFTFTQITICEKKLGVTFFTGATDFNATCTRIGCTICKDNPMGAVCVSTVAGCVRKKMILLIASRALGVLDILAGNNITYATHEGKEPSLRRGKEIGKRRAPWKEVLIRLGERTLPLDQALRDADKEHAELSEGLREAHLVRAHLVHQACGPKFCDRKVIIRKAHARGGTDLEKELLAARMTQERPYRIVTPAAV